MPNPWVPRPEPDAQEPPQDGERIESATTEVPTLAPQPGIEPLAATDRFPRRNVDGHVADVWWVGVHGGAGETTLEELLEGSRAAGHAWPTATPPLAPPRVVLVARTHARGLQAAQLAATEWASGDVATDLLGLALLADAPGRLPRALRDFAALVSGGVPRVWRLPWVEAWRTGEPVSDTAPKAARRLLDDLRALTSDAAEAAPLPPTS